MNTTLEKYISVDIEAAGPIPGVYSMLSIGACHIYNESARFTCELKPINNNFIPEALNTSGLSLDELTERGLEPIDAMNEFSAWLNSINESDQRIVFVGFNAPFDWSFINYYFHRYHHVNPFGFAALDIKSLYMGKTKCAWDDTTSSKIANKLAPSHSGNHNALQDALYQSELFRLIQAL